MSETILSELTGTVLQLTINRPAQKNALDKAMYKALADYINEASANSAVRVLIITGSEGCFSSGNDLSDFKAASGALSDDDPVLQFMNALAGCPKPVVAAVEGVAVGIGSTMLLHCDLIYAKSDARFCLPFANLGLCPEYASTFLLPRLAGYAKAAEWLMLGDMFSAAEAHEAGLINKIVENPLALAKETAEKISQKAPSALRKTKALLKAPVQERIQQVMVEEFKLFGEGLMGDEFKEAVSAFFEKRPADFSSFE